MFVNLRIEVMKGRRVLAEIDSVIAAVGESLTPSTNQEDEANPVELYSRNDKGVHFIALALEVAITHGTSNPHSLVIPAA